MALWPAKKDQDEDNDPIKIKVPNATSHGGGESGSGETEPADLNRLTERLAELGNMLGEVPPEKKKVGHNHYPAYSLCCQSRCGLLQAGVIKLKRSSNNLRTGWQEGSHSISNLGQNLSNVSSASLPATAMG